MKTKKKWIALTVILMVLAIISFSHLTIPRTTVMAASIPGTTINSGESAIVYRFAVSAEGADTKIEQIYLTFSPGASLTNLCFYDDNGNQLPGALYYNSEGMIRYWPGWPTEPKIVIPKGTTSILNLRANVAGQGATTIRMEDMVVEKGSVRGLPTISITLQIK